MDLHNCKTKVELDLMRVDLNKLTLDELMVLIYDIQHDFSYGHIKSEEIRINSLAQIAIEVSKRYERNGYKWEV